MFPKLGQMTFVFLIYVHFIVTLMYSICFQIKYKISVFTKKCSIVQQVHQIQSDWISNNVLLGL